jgi:hypothetical protein
MTAKTALAITCLLAGGPAFAQDGAIHIEAGVAAPGESARVELLFDSGEFTATALVVDIGFDPATPIRPGGDGAPDCTFDADVRRLKESSRVVYRPAGCVVGETCRGARATVLSFNPNNNGLPVPSGLLLTCRVRVPDDVPVGSELPLALEQATLADTSGAERDVTKESEGDVVEVVPKPTCVGDCDADGSVRIVELIRAVRLLLADTPPESCAPLDADESRGVTIDEVIDAVGNAGRGCPTASG